MEIILKNKKYSSICALLAVQCLLLWNLTGHLDYWQHQVHSLDISNFVGQTLLYCSSAVVTAVWLFYYLFPCLGLSVA